MEHYFVCLTVIASDLEWLLNVVSSTGNITETVVSIITAYITCDVTSVTSSEISSRKFPEIYSNLSGNFWKFVKEFFLLSMFPSAALQSDAV